ncbi:uncharacterized protein TrAFT101_007259 [Trichoderma asperellum]|uniref:uncharacterized protein n=1 Tax=Trichoderma asperellum TaxID=101201 RepID=UPI0033252B85|nr:hypothetical protein TrAFT101_007259 [Trichoderma asperellum]
MNLADLLPRSDEEKFLGSEYSERLEKFKPIIIQLYMGNYGPGGKRMTKRQITEFMKDKYAFHLAVNQLEYNLREKWKVRRRILNREKDDVTTALGKRARTGASTSDATLQEGKPLDTKQLKRHLQDKIRRFVVEPMVPGVLSAWNLPYAALIKSIVRQADKPSPFGDLSNTPGYITIKSPRDAIAVSPTAVPSPSTQLVQQTWTYNQSNLFLQGRFQELFINCKREDRIALTNYFHEFWIHTFVTAKYWGRGPLFWTKDMVSAMTDTSFANSGLTPVSPADRPTPLSSISHDGALLQPEQYCRWVIHVTEEHAVPGLWEDYQPPSNFDQNSWMPWPSGHQANRPLTHLMHESLTKSDFTSLSPDNLPISSSLISESISNDPRPLQLESFKFAIMAGNLELVESILGKARQEKDLNRYFMEIYPYHLAATYLDGGNTCCSLLAIIIRHFSGRYAIARNNEDSMGHTVFDCLIISILRSHTNVAPRDVSSGFVDMKRYPGEEKDVCGRWDADSPIIRQLFQRGSYRIPFGWKHPFCHSSVQAVCHNLIAIFFPGNYNPHIRHPSGLFVRLCGNCASGVQGETLFGAVAVLVCLLRLGANIHDKTQVSIDDILGDSSADVCRHASMDADEFMQTIPLETIDLWRPECRTAWSCMLGIFRLAKSGKLHHINKSPPQNSEINEASNDEDDDEDEDECQLFEEHSNDSNFPCGNRQLGLIWAVTQAEMLTYRRILGVDPWISDNFSMDALRQWLDGESEEVQMPLVREEMLQNTTPCGWFVNHHFPFATATSATKQHIMNMDVYHRTSFHSVPDLGDIIYSKKDEERFGTLN